MSEQEITIRPEAPGDRDAIRAVTTQAFEGAAEGRIVDALRATGRFLPSGSLVATAAGKVVGHLLLSWVPLRRPDGELDARVAAAIGPVAVAPEIQRQGIGSKLMEAAIPIARAAGARVVILLGHTEYYPRFGFTPATPQGIECPFPGAPDNAWMALRLDEREPVPTGRPEYPPAWNQE